MKNAYAEMLEENCARWAGIARAYAAGTDREDLLQEILLQVWKALPQFEGRSHRDTWAYRVALNTALAWDRSSRNRRRILRTEMHFLSRKNSDTSSEFLESRILNEFLESLSKVDRAVMLTYLDGLSNTDAAEVTGLSQGAFRVRLHRLRQKFEETYCNERGD